MKKSVVKKIVVKVVKEAPKIKAKKAVKKEVVKSGDKKKKPSSKLSSIRKKRGLYLNDVFKIENAIVDNKDICVLYQTGGMFLICKKISLEIKKTNEQSVFQPREYTEKKNYCVLAILETERSVIADLLYFRQCIDNGCPIYTINRIEDIELSLKEMG